MLAIGNTSGDPTDAAKCSVVPTQKKPLIVEWGSADRGALEASMPDGLLVVRYSGCEMEVLSCYVRGQQYDYRGFTQKSSLISIRNADELYAQMPIGAAKLEGRLEKADALTVAMTTVGMFQAKTLEVGPSDLEGICEGATHFVHRVQVGAYEFYAEQSAEVGAEGGVAGGPRGGAKSTAGREVLNRDGDAAKCEAADAGDAAPPRGCAAPLRLEVIPLGAATGPVCPSESSWDGSQCIRKDVVTEVTCPAGSSWDGAKCVRADVVTQVTCPSGTQWDGSECLGDQVRGPARAVPPHDDLPARTTSGPGHLTFVSLSGGKFMSHRIDPHSVTREEYTACVNGGSCPRTKARGRAVRYSEAAAYCKAKGRLLFHIPSRVDERDEFVEAMTGFESWRFGPDYDLEEYKKDSGIPKWEREYRENVRRRDAGESWHDVVSIEDGKMSVRKAEKRDVAEFRCVSRLGEDAAARAASLELAETQRREGAAKKVRILELERRALEAAKRAR